MPFNNGIWEYDMLWNEKMEVLEIESKTIREDKKPQIFNNAEIRLSEVLPPDVYREELGI